MVSVERQAAVASDPTGRKVEVLEHYTARATAFGRVGGVYKGHLTTSVFSFVREILPKRIPSAVQDAFAQVVVANHIANAQIFQRDLVETAHQVGAELVQKVFALVGDVFLLTLHRTQRFATVVAAPLCTGELALQDTETFLSHAVVGGMHDLITITGGEQSTYAHVYPYSSLGYRHRFRLFHLARKAGVPLTCFVNDPHRLHSAFDGTMPANANTPDPIQLEATTIQPSPYAVLLEGERVEVLSPLETRVARLLTRLDAAKEGLKRFVHIITDGLYRLAEDYLRLREGLSILDTCALLLGFRDATRFKFVAPLSLRKAHVVPMTAHVQHLEHLPFLCGRWVQAVLEGFKRHLDCPLVFDVLLDHGEWSTANRRNEVRMCPQGRQATLQVGKLSAEQARTASFDVLHKSVDTELRVYLTQNMNVIRHDLKLKYLAAKFGSDFLNDFLQANIHPIDQHLTSILRTKHHMVLARVDHVMVALERSVFAHASYYTALSYLLQRLRLISPQLMLGALRRFFGKADGRAVPG